MINDLIERNEKLASELTEMRQEMATLLSGRTARKHDIFTPDGSPEREDENKQTAGAGFKTPARPKATVPPVPGRSDFGDDVAAARESRSSAAAAKVPDPEFDNLPQKGRTILLFVMG